MTGYFGPSLLETERKRIKFNFQTKIYVYGMDICKGHEQRGTHRFCTVSLRTLTGSQRQRDRATDAIRIKSTISVENTAENLICYKYHVI